MKSSKIEKKSKEELEKKRKSFKEKYGKKLDECFKYLKKETDDSQLSTWTHFKTIDNEIECYHKKPLNDSTLKAYLGIGYVPHPPEKILSLLYVRTLKERKPFDPILEEFFTVEQYTDTKEVGYLRYKSPARFLFSDRDMIALRDTKSEGDVHYHLFTSCDDMKVYNGIVKKRSVCRMDIVRCGWVLKWEKDKKRTKVYYITCVNLNGMIPSWIINITTRVQPECVKLLKNELKRLGGKNGGSKDKDESEEGEIEED